MILNTIENEGDGFKFYILGHYNDLAGKTKEAKEGNVFYGEESSLRFKAIIPEWLERVEREREEKDRARDEL